ncbi:hypothetical protein VTI74DRAFT_7327 [Chaetomium olivicolor]
MANTNYMAREDWENDLAREAAIYTHLGDHPYILKCVGLEQHYAGLAYLHSQGVQHYDMRCRNLFLFDGFRVKPILKATNSSRRFA